MLLTFLRRASFFAPLKILQVVPSGQFMATQYASSTFRRMQPWEALEPSALVEELVGPFFFAVYSTEWNSMPRTTRVAHLA